MTAIKNPDQLVNEFKKSSEFTRLRRELLTQFQNSDGLNAFMARVDDVVQKRLDADPKLQFMPQEYVQRELLQELDRYPIVERALSDFHAQTEARTTAQLRQSLQKTLRNDRGGAPSRIDQDRDDDDAERPMSMSPDARQPSNLGGEAGTGASTLVGESSGRSPGVNGTLDGRGKKGPR